MIWGQFRRALAALAIACFSVFLTSAPAAAQRECMCGRPPSANPYEGLLPSDFAINDANASFGPAALTGIKLAIIPSSNFNEYSRRWVAFYEGGGQERNWAYNLMGMNRDTVRSQEHSSDPRHFADRLVVLLEPYVGEVIVATDFHNAREQGATYYIVIDSWLGSTRMGMRLSSWASLSVFDAELNRVFFAQGMHEARRGGGGINESVIEADAASQREAVAGATDPLLTALQTRLGPAAPR